MNLKEYIFTKKTVIDKPSNSIICETSQVLVNPSVSFFPMSVQVCVSLVPSSVNFTELTAFNFTFNFLLSKNNKKKKKKKRLFLGQIFEIEMLIGLHILRTAESENHNFSGQSVYVCACICFERNSKTL